ncbi:MAG: hypothetical protein ACXAEU_25665 [Candidatus Hodarchaeales archaeon]|jgi:hypothetical protein
MEKQANSKDARVIDEFTARSGKIMGQIIHTGNGVSPRSNALIAGKGAPVNP